MENEKRTYTIQEKIDYYLAKHGDLMNDMRLDIYNPSEPCFMKKLDDLTEKIKALNDEQEKQNRHIFNL